MGKALSGLPPVLNLQQTGSRDRDTHEAGTKVRSTNVPRPISDSSIRAQPLASSLVSKLLARGFSPARLHLPPATCRCPVCEDSPLHTSNCDAGVMESLRCLGRGR